MKIRNLFICMVLLSGFLTSCAPTIEPPTNMGYNFIPIDTGRYYIYNVDSIYVDCAAGIWDTAHYQLKETYPSVFVDGMGDTVLNVTRYYRTDTTQPWIILNAIPDVWWLKRTTTRLEKTEENLTYVKMTYPIGLDDTWDGNAYNVLDAQDYYYGTSDVSFNNGFTTFDSTITVYQQLDTGNLIQYYLFTETYARNIGMVHKLELNVPNAIVYDSNTNNPPVNSCWQYIPSPLFWYQVYILNRIKLGSLVTYKLIEYGFE